MAPDDLPAPEFVFEQRFESLEPPIFPDSEPRIFKPERIDQLDPFEMARLDRTYVEMGQVTLNLQLRKAMAAAVIRERELGREADNLDRVQRRASELETEKWERVDRRVQRYAMLVLLIIAAVAAITLAFLTLNSSEAAVRITPGAGVVVAIVAGLRLRALGDGDSTSIWDWLIRRQERSATN
jgi:hypothetical protein